MTIRKQTNEELELENASDCELEADTRKNGIYFSVGDPEDDDYASMELSWEDVGVLQSWLTSRLQEREG